MKQFSQDKPKKKNPQEINEAVVDSAFVRPD